MRAPGTNCDRETVIALEIAGADVESVHLERLLAATRDLDDFGLVVLPGGFSFGDHLGAGALWAHRLETVRDELDRFVESGRPVLGQDTGLGELLPVGEGLLTYRTLEEAAAGVEAIARDYPRHCRAARAIAEEVFDSDKVLRRLLGGLGVA